jgi:hypothetical protein
LFILKNWGGFFVEILQYTFQLAWKRSRFVLGLHSGNMVGYFLFFCDYFCIQSDGMARDIKSTYYFDDGTCRMSKSAFFCAPFCLLKLKYPSDERTYVRWRHNNGWCSAIVDSTAHLPRMQVIMSFNLYLRFTMYIAGDTAVEVKK